jgi:peptidoglycan/xylan/chitin deacetylase (PgdA/CDA1 family)
MLLTIDDTQSENIEVAHIIKKHGLQEDCMFFASFNDDGAQTKLILREAEMGFQIGSHTITHRNLTTLDDAELKWELEASKTILETLTQQEVPWFAYPFGHYDSRVVEAVARAGYRYARTCDAEDQGPLLLGSFQLDGFDFEVAKRSGAKIFGLHARSITMNNTQDLFKDFLAWWQNEPR